MQNPVNKFTLESDETIQTRRAQAVDQKFAEAIHQVLQANNKVVACYLLDARKPNAEETIQIIALTVENEENDLDFVSQQLREMIQKFPKHLGKTFMMSSVNFKDDYLGSEFYVRGSENTMFSRFTKKLFGIFGLRYRS